MNRVLRTEYSSSFAYLFLALIPALATGVGMPLPAFLCLYFGLLLFLLPCAVPKLSGREALFAFLGVLAELLGFLPIRLYGCPLIHYIAHALGVIAAGVFVGVMKHRTTHDDFSAKFRFSVVFILVFVGVMYLSLLIGITEEFVVPISRANIKTAVEHAIPIAILLLVTGVLLLRGLRGLDGTVNERDFNRRQLRDVLVFAAGVSTVLLINPLLYRGLVWVMNNVVVAGANRLAWAFNKLLEFIASKGPKLNEQPVVIATENASEYVPPPQSGMMTEQEPESYMIDDAGEKVLYKSLLYIFLAIAAAVLLVILIIELVKLIKKLRRRGGGRGRGYPNEIREALDDDAPKKADKPKKRGEPRIRIRYYYREFMRYMRRIPITIRPSDTCGDINESAEASLRVNEEELSEFRDIYEQARYSAESVPTEQDAARMKTLYERLRNKRA